VSARYTSTGHLPAAADVQARVDEAYQTYRDVPDGRVSQVYPALAAMPADLFGVCVAGVTGRLFPAGDAGREFAIMSVAKPFTFALVCDALGTEQARERLGANATGRPFDSLAAIERAPGGRTNPMVNAGAIAAVSLAPGRTTEDKWCFIVGGLSRFAGRDLTLDLGTYDSASATNHRNRAIAWLLRGREAIYCDPGQALDLYTRQSCLAVTATDLAVMGATLADGGVNPVTREPVISPEAGRAALTVMATAGLYETSGDWLYDTGVPGKSGIGGGIVAVSPGKGGLGTFAPPLDGAGNSVKGQLVARFLSARLGMTLFDSAPASSGEPDAR
jgi:glutaminase